jgi:hypothetical protein
MCSETSCFMKRAIFWDITPCSPLRVNRRFGGTCRLHFQGRKMSCTRDQRESSCHLLSRWSLAQLIFIPWRWSRYVPRNVGWLSTGSACHLLSRWSLAQLIFSTLKMEAIGSSETWVDFQQTTRRYIPEDGTLHNHRCENRKFLFHVRTIFYRYNISRFETLHIIYVLCSYFQENTQHFWGCPIIRYWPRLLHYH